VRPNTIDLKQAIFGQKKQPFIFINHLTIRKQNQTQPA